MWPKEHGAYGQLVFPLVAAFAVAGVSPAAVLTSVAAAAGLLAHEPLVVLLGRRGPRAKREGAARARRWLVFWSALAGAAGFAALWLAPAGTRWSFMLPLVPAAVVAAAMFVERERSTVGEIAVAVAFSAVAIPVCLSSGASLPTASSIAVVFAAIFTAGTLSVRAVVLNVRGGGDPHAVRATRLVLLLLSVALAYALALGIVRAAVPSATLIAVVPGLAVSLGLATRPPAPTRLRAVGWTLVSASAAAAAILIVGLHAS
jgi:hypothetical protein